MNKIKLNYKELPLSYSLKEVRSLNEITFGSYVLGCANDEIIAIIGLDEDFVNNIGNSDKSIIIEQNNKATEMKIINKKLAKECEKEVEYKVYPTQKEFDNDVLLREIHKMLLKKRANREKMEEKRKRKDNNKHSIH